MRKRLIIGPTQLDITLKRLCHQLIEEFPEFKEAVLIGLQPRGIPFGNALKSRLEGLGFKNIPFGMLDTTFFRDDFRRKNKPLKANTTEIPFLIENRHVILVDDVLYTGRSTRAALDAMIAFGRPKSVSLLVLVNRKHTQELPIQSSFTGHFVNTLSTQRVEVEWDGKDNLDGKIWLVDQKEENG